MRYLAVVVLLGWVVRGPGAVASEARWQELDARAAAAQAAGDLNGALDAASGALGEARASFERADRRLARTLETAGWLNAVTGHLVDGRTLLDETLKLREAVVGQQHTDVARSLILLAWLDHHEGRYAEAQARVERAFRLLEACPDPAARAGLAPVLEDLGVIQACLRRYPEAAENLRRAIDLRSRSGGDAFSIVRALTSLAEVERTRGRFTEAQALCREALGRLAPGPPWTALTARATRALAMALASCGQADEAVRLHLQAIQIRERVGGPDRPGLDRYLRTLGELYLSQGRVTDAEPLFERAALLAKGQADPGPMPVVSGLAFDPDLVKASRPGPVSGPPVTSRSQAGPPAATGAPLASPAVPAPAPIAPASPAPPAPGTAVAIDHAPDPTEIASMGGSANDWLVMTLNSYPEPWRIEQLQASPRRLAMLIQPGSSDTSQVKYLRGLRGEVTVVLSGYPDTFGTEALAAAYPAVGELYVTRSAFPTPDQGDGSWANSSRQGIGAAWPDQIAVDFLNRLPQRTVLVVAGYPDTLAVEQINRLGPRVEIVVNTPTQPDISAVDFLNKIRRPVRLYIQAPSITAPYTQSELSRLARHVTVLEGLQFGIADIVAGFHRRIRR